MRQYGSFFTSSAGAKRAAVQPVIALHDTGAIDGRPVAPATEHTRLDRTVAADAVCVAEEATKSEKRR